MRQLCRWGMHITHSHLCIAHSMQSRFIRSMGQGFWIWPFLTFGVTKVFCGEMSCPLRMLVCLVAPWLVTPTTDARQHTSCYLGSAISLFPTRKPLPPIVTEPEDKSEWVYMRLYKCLYSVSMPLWFEGLCSLKFLRWREITNVIALDDRTLGEVILENTLP